MQRVNMHEAKTNLSQLVARAEAGETIEIMRAGKVVATLAARAKPRRVLGLHPELVPAADWDSDELNEEVAREFNGR